MRQQFQSMIRRSYQDRPLTDAEINSFAPSVFATEPWVQTSNRYAFVPTSNVIMGLREAGFMPYSVAQSRSNIPGKEFFTKHVIRFRSLNEAMTRVGDTSVEVILVNSHDGSSVYEIDLGAFRLACLNGAVVSEGLVHKARIRHTGSIITEVIDVTNKLIEQAPKVVEAIKRWKTIDLKPQEAHLLAKSAHSLRFDEETANAPSVEKLLQARRLSDNGTDLWTTFNRIQENTVEGGLRTYSDTGRKNKTRAVTGIAENMKLNRALWTLAEEMAKIKTA